MDLNKLCRQAEDSAFYRLLLSLALRFMVPFNRGHAFRIEEISHRHLVVKAPYRRRNLNHVKGIHACALATIAEISSGLFLLSRLDAKRYRIILSRLELDYTYQAKTHAYARFEADHGWLEQELFQKLAQSEKTILVCPIHLYDAQGKELCKAKAHWQVKDWQAVKTKV